MCLLREQRSYLHSTDIFEQITNLKKNSNLNGLTINFKKRISSLPYIIITKKPSQKKQSESYTNFKFKIGKKLFFGYIFQHKKRLISRKLYKEEIFQREVSYDKKNIYIPNFDKFNFVEKITSAAMKFLKKTSSEKKNKWYLANLTMSKYLKKKKYKNLKLIINKKIGKIFIFEIFSNQKEIGKMLFIKK